MARLVSPFPPHHRACPEGNGLLAPPLVAALLDGDATVVVRSTNGRAPGPRVLVAARDDDPTPFAIAVSIARHRGRPLGWMRRQADARRNEWIVDAPGEILDLVAWLRAVAPPLAPRLDAALWVVVEAAARLSEPAPPTRADLDELARRSTRISRSAAPLPSTTALAEASDDRVWWEVSGLLASDGHLAIRDRHARSTPVAVISQRTDNLALLAALRERTGLGDLVTQGTQVSWRIARSVDCATLAAQLRDFPLPASAPRACQLEIWTSAVAEKAGGRGDADRLAAAADALRAARAYRGPHLLCSCSPSGPTAGDRTPHNIGESPSATKKNRKARKNKKYLGLVPSRGALLH